MIRECFKAKTGIIFDAHMVRHEAGLNIDGDTDPTFVATKPPSPGNHRLRKSDGTELNSFSLSHVLAVVISGLGSRFHSAWGNLSSPRSRGPEQQSICLLEPPEKPVSPVEAQEETEVALSPIYDKIKMDPEWKIVDWIPCKLSPTARSQ